jgi:hypothetical protein
MKLYCVVFLVTFGLVPAVALTARQAGGRRGPNEALRDELVRMGEEDQKYRVELQDKLIEMSKAGAAAAPTEELMSLQRRQDELDTKNMARLAEIVAAHGWPGRSLVGEEASRAAFLILQHAGLSSQKKYFPLLKRAASKGDARPADAAMLEDRILMREGRKQVYGTQVHSGPETGGKLELYPLEDEGRVDERRAAVGLPPLAEYLKAFGLDYEPRSKGGGRRRGRSTGSTP